MKKIITVHSFRRGAGKSNLVANMAAHLGSMGLRAGVIDADFHAPSMQIFHHLDEDEIDFTLNDYLVGRCDILQAAYDVTYKLGLRGAGKVFVAPASSVSGDILHMLHAPFDFDRFSQGLHTLIDLLELDILVLDTSAGLSEETLSAIAVSSTLVVLLRTDQQDYQGTAVTVEIARSLQSPRPLLVLNDAPLALNLDNACGELEAAFGCPVAALLPHCEELQALASRGAFVLHYPTHPMAGLLRRLTERVASDG